jgi:hypothetical protein
MLVKKHLKYIEIAISLSDSIKMYSVGKQYRPVLKALPSSRLGPVSSLQRLRRCGGREKWM